MSIARIGIIGLAIAGAGLAAMLARSGSAPQPMPAPPIRADLERVDSGVEVLTARRDLPTGSILNPDDVVWRPWPGDGVDDDYFSRADSPDAATEIAGRIARLEITAGEPILSRKLVEPGEGGVMAALIAPGKRAVSVRISEETGAGGFILPGDRVDVITVRRGSGENSGDSAYAGTILSGVRVLAIDQTLREIEGESVVVGEVATLELEPMEAEDLSRASLQGSIALSLRGLVASDAHTAPHHHAIRMVRFGRATTIPVDHILR